MQKKKPEIDIVDKVLNACYNANKNALFIMSLMHQYEERGSLSKKQLQGLFQKAQKVEDIPVSWLATLEALILKMPNRFKSEVSLNKPLFAKDEASGEIIKLILAKYPQHKRVLFLRSKYENNEVLTTSEKEDLQKFQKLLIKQ